MNEALRLMRRLVRRWGYEIKKADDYVLRPVAGFDAAAGLRDMRVAFDRDTPWTDELDTRRLTVFLRTCLRAHRNPDKRPRVTGASDEENALRCLLSTVTSLNDAAAARGAEALEVVVLDDRSEPRALARLKELLERLACRCSVHETRDTGPGGSLIEEFTRARALSTLVYFCEDDYLHEPGAVAEMWDFFERVARTTGGPSMLAPQEHHTLYEAHYPSYIFAGATRRWRTVSDATHTFLTHGRVVDRFWRLFEDTKYMGTTKRHLASEKRTTNRLTEHLPGFAPIPPLAVHLQYAELLPPLYDWRPLWEANRVYVEGHAL